MTESLCLRHLSVLCVVWATLERRPFLSRTAATKLSDYLHQYASEKGIYMKLNYVNADHVHGLVDLPTSLTIEEMMHLFKGASSHWINESNLLRTKFAWGRGYGAFSVSHSLVGKWPAISPDRRNITVSEASQTN